MADPFRRCLALALIGPLLAAAAPAIPQQRQTATGLDRIMVLDPYSEAAPGQVDSGLDGGS